ncbi:MAG: response regulator [Desulfobacteraceae bacterium]
MNSVETLTPTHQDAANILVMEDETTVAKGLEMVLSEAGYQVALAATGHTALDTMFEKQFDLLVADLRLPDMDGLDVIERVKDKWPGTEVVVITGYSSVDSAVRSMKLGAHDYLPKPFSEDQIKESVRSALGTKEEKETPAPQIVARVETEEEKLIQKREVIQVLNRAAEDADFWIDLMENGSAALGEYQLSSEACAAIASGDLNWINTHVGELTQKQLQYIFKRLEREAW